MMPPAEAYACLQYLHMCSSCGYPGGCNNMSQQTPPIEGLRLDGLPARVTLRLWYERPATPTAPADRIYVIDIR